MNKPKEGSIVAAKGMFNGKVRTERCVYKNGRFMAGGDFPVPSFELRDVTEWKYEKL